MHVNTRLSGFTLVELLVAILASGIVLLTASMMLFMPFRVMRTNAEYANVRRDLALAMRMMANDIRDIPYRDATDIVATDDLLQLLPNPPDYPDKVEYIRDTASGSLSRYVNDANQESIITEGLSQFRPTATNNPFSGLRGVILHLEMDDPAGTISIIQETFVHTRN